MSTSIATLARLLLLGAFSMLVACGDDSPGGDVGTADPDAGVEADSGTTELPDLGVLDLGEAQARCTEPTDPTCVDEQITQLTLYTNVATGVITNESTAVGDFRHLVDARGGGLSPTQSFLYARFTAAGLEKVAISDDAAFDSMDWDIGFRRYVVRTNSGVSGPACTGVARVPGNPSYDDVTTVPTNLDFRTEAYMSEGTCEIVPDGSGLPGSAATALGSFWAYQACVQMTGNVFVLALTDGRFIKLQVLSYYDPGPQETCNQTGSVPSPSGAGNIRIRWAFIE